MKKALIITAHVEHLNDISLSYSSYSHIICADGGLRVAKQLQLTPSLFIGDYDSIECPDDEQVIRLPMEKDVTDTEAAIELAVNYGFTDLTVLGGLGGRLDHTMGNLAMLAKYCGILEHLSFVDGQNCVFMYPPGKYIIPRNTYPFLGVISFDETAENVTLQGVKYPLINYTLPNNTSLGVSNEITSDYAEISFTSGKLLIILSKDVDK